MIENPKIGQKVWFVEHWSQCIHSAKITALGETEVSVRNPEKYPYADIEWDDGGNSGCLLKNLYASCEELQKELKKEEEKKIAEIKAKIRTHGVGACGLGMEGERSAAGLLIVKFRAIGDKEPTHVKAVLIWNLQNNGVVVLDFEDERIQPVGTGYNTIIYCILSRHIVRG